MQSATKFYSLVTFGSPASRIEPFYSSEQAAQRAALDAKGTGTCSTVRIYECDSERLARTADMSMIRTGERIVATI